MTLTMGRAKWECILITSVLIRGKVTSASYFSFSFVAAMRVNILWRLFHETLNPFRKGVKVKVFHESILIIAATFTGALFIHTMENLAGSPWGGQYWRDWDSAEKPQQVFTTTASLYMIMCTISTIGYGDVPPKSIMGQITLMLVMIAGLAVCLFTILGVIEAYQNSNRGGGEYHISKANRYRHHIVITGSLCAQTLQELLDEVYHGPCSKNCRLGLCSHAIAWLSGSHGQRPHVSSQKIKPQDAGSHVAAHRIALAQTGFVSRKT